MVDFVTLSCPNCGGKLKVTSDIDRFACSHCGVEQIVKRGEGIVSLSPVLDAIAKVQGSVDVIANDIKERKAKETIATLKDEIFNLENQLTWLKNKKNKESVKKLQSQARASLIIAILFTPLAIAAAIAFVVSKGDSVITIIFVCLFELGCLVNAFESRKKAGNAAKLEQSLNQSIPSKRLELEKQQAILVQLSE